VYPAQVSAAEFAPWSKHGYIIGACDKN
jgi:hypothetical protein